jgi:hypothetical protein
MGNSMRSLRRTILWTASVLLALPVVLYLALFSLQGFSVWQASRLLTRAEALQLGASKAAVEEALQPCKTEWRDSRCQWNLTSGPYRSRTVLEQLWKLRKPWPDRILQLLEKGGLRYWQINIAASLPDNRLQRLELGLYSVGRYEALGTAWTIAPGSPEYPRTTITPIPGEDKTSMHWFHITSDPSGEGFRIQVTPGSTPGEIGARRINRKCLISFRGCDGLCELLPQADSLLRKDNRDFGGFTSVPSSPCDSPGIRQGREWLRSMPR